MAYRRERSNDDFKARRPEKAADFLPEASILESYNYVIEGSAETILDMLQKEQDHRHEWEMKALTVQQNGLMFGQIVAGLLGVSVVMLVGILALNDQANMAVFTAVLGFSCLTVAYVKGRQTVVAHLVGTLKKRQAQRQQAKPLEKAPRVHAIETPKGL